MKELEQVLKQHHLETTEPWTSLWRLVLVRVKSDQSVLEIERKFGDDRSSTASSHYQSLINAKKLWRKHYQEEIQRLKGILSQRPPLSHRLSKYLRDWLHDIPNWIKEGESTMKIWQQRLSELKVSNSGESSATQPLLSDPEQLSADSDFSSHGSMSPPRKDSPQSTIGVETTKDILTQGVIEGATGPASPRTSPGIPKTGSPRHGSGTGGNTVGASRQGSPDNRPGNKFAHASSVGKGPRTGFRFDGVRIDPPDVEREPVQSSNGMNQPRWCQEVVDLVKNKQFHRAAIACGLCVGTGVGIGGLAAQHRPAMLVGSGIVLSSLCPDAVAKCWELSKWCKAAERARNLHRQ